MSNGYPVHGLIEQVKEKMCSVNTATEIINHYIEESCKKGYREAIADVEKKLLSRRVGGPSRCDLTPLGMIVPTKENESLKSAFISKEV